MNTELIKKAKKLAKQYHQGQTYNGKTYYNAHLIPVMQLAEIISPEDLKEKVVLVAILHDILEDTNCDPECIKKAFGTEVLESVLFLTKKAKIGYNKYFKDISNNKIAKIVKTADRLVNIYHLKDVKDQQQKEKLIKKYEEQITYIKAYF